MENIICKVILDKQPLREKFWSVFPHVWTEYGDSRSKYRYSVQMRENPDQKNSVFGHFLRSEPYPIFRHRAIFIPLTTSKNLIWGFNKEHLEKWVELNLYLLFGSPLNLDTANKLWFWEKY